MAVGSEISSTSTKNVLYFYITLCLPNSFKAGNIKGWSVGRAKYLTSLHESDKTCVSLLVYKNTRTAQLHQPDKCKEEMSHVKWKAEYTYDQTFNFQDTAA
jgi:hypothetical protein